MKYFFLLSVFLLSFSCKKNEKPSIYHGEINVGIDEAVSQLVEAQTESYRSHYPGAKFNNYIIPENEAVKLLLEDSMDVICITRLLNESEMKVLEERKIKYKPAPMALDAVVLVVNPEYANDAVGFDDLKKFFQGGDASTKLVFDRGNSSNLNYVLGSLGITDFDRKNVVSAGGTENVVEWVKKDKNAIGFIGYNYISELKSQATLDVRNSIKILGVSSTGEAIKPDKKTILHQTYPFNRIVYLHTLGSAWGVENGFIRFACTKTGQLVAEKMGLIPYYSIPKQFVLSKEELDN